ncbi:hypothetical protein MMC28_007858 [Mycoblastus sanguinarius]|nr:hypothetical protein [Mycoblastus sanguinarius]
MSVEHEKWLSYRMKSYRTKINRIKSDRLCMLSSQYAESIIPGSPNTAIRLQILRSCLQIHNEASKILWSTNTFSFYDTETFSRFMGSRKPHQLQLLKSLGLQIGYISSGRYSVGLWNSVLNTSLVRSLHGLRHLILFIGQFNCTDDLRERLLNRPNNSLSEAEVDIGDGLLNLSTLSLTTVKVAVREVVLLSSIERGYQKVYFEDGATIEIYVDAIRSQLTRFRQDEKDTQA